MTKRAVSPGRSAVRWGAGALALAGVLSACTADGPDVSTGTASNPTTATTPRVTGGGGGRGSRVGLFQPFGDCGEFLDYVQTEALARVTPYGLGGGPVYSRNGGAVAEDTSGGSPATSAPTPVPSAGTKDGDYSTTNTQEVGVDEGDIVETDGRYIYSVMGPALLVTDVDGGAVVDRVDLAGSSGNAQLLLDTDGHRLAVISQNWTGSVNDVVVTLYDTNDPSDLRRVSRTHLEGIVVATRAVGGVARLVVSTPLGSGLTWAQPGFAVDEKAALARNQAVIKNSTEADWLPRSFTEATDGSYGLVSPALACDQIGNPEQFSGLGISWVATLDLRGSDVEAHGAAGVVATGEQVYASKDSLYITTVPWDFQYGNTDAKIPEGPPPTSIHQFDLNAADGADYLASGTVTGYLLNSYSMSEYDGVLRVATTEFANGFGTQTSSGVHTLRRDGAKLVELGSVEGLGTDEQIQAVRFLGSLGYVVTFRQVDPLYVIDLRDPAAPRVAGQLKIPGFSSYLAPVADGWLVGVGADATDEGMITGGQLSLFDVRNPDDPKRVSTVPIGTGQSEASWDPHAFLYWAADGSVVVPTSYGWNCPVNAGCPVGYDGTNAALVARFADESLTLRGVITQPKQTVNPDQWCWYGPGIRRSMVLGDRLVTLSERGVLVSGLADLADRQWIPFGNAETPCEVVMID